MKNRLGFVVIVSVLFAVLSPAAARADTWPNKYWNNADDYSLDASAASGSGTKGTYISLDHDGSKHNVTSTMFRAWMTGNTKLIGGTFPVDINSWGGSNTTTVTVTSGGASASGSDPTVNIPYASGTFYKGNNATAYDIRVSMDQTGDGEKYNFEAVSASVTRFGFKAGEQVPFASSVAGRGTFIDADMSFRTSCEQDAVASAPDITVHDSDNAHKWHIQNGFPWVAAKDDGRDGNKPGDPATKIAKADDWGDWDGDKYVMPVADNKFVADGGNYHPLYLQLLNAASVPLGANSTTSAKPDSSWTPVGTLYRPDNGTSQATMYMNYTYMPYSSYTIQLINLGIANYIGLTLPFDEGAPACKEWSVTPNVPDVAGSVGQPVTINHTMTPAGGPYADSGAISGDISGDFGSDTTTLDRGSLPGAAWSHPLTKTFDTRGKRCSTLTASPSSSKSSGAVSDEGCVVIAGWDVNADSRVTGANSADGRSKTIYVGQTATFNHRLWTTGDALHKDINGDVLSNAKDFDTTNVDNDCLNDGTGPNNCWDYRYTSTDLTSADSDQTATRTYTFKKEGTYCEYQRFNPSRDDEPNAGSGTQACVYVIDPLPTISSSIPYEKNESGLDPAIIFTVAPPSGYCPPPTAASLPVTLRYTIFFPGPAPDLTGDVPGNWGGAAGCNPIPYSVTTFTDPLQKDELNDASPGDQFKFKTRVVETGIESGEGNITVEEVPFARFYGNDIVSRGSNPLDEIRFNTSSTNNTVGSVSQFGVFSTNATKIITSAAFRAGLPAGPLGTLAQTQPPNGLKSTIPTNIPTVSSMIDNDIEMPSGCTTSLAVDAFKAALPIGTVCYDLPDTGAPRYIGSSTPAVDPTYKGRITIKTAGTVVIDGNIANTTFDPPPPSIPPPVAYAYQHHDYAGYQIALGEGTYDTAEILSMGGLPNDLSSIQVTSGYRVTVYDGNNLTGASYIFTADQPQFVPIGWNDRIESIKVEKIVPTAVPTIDTNAMGVLMIIADNIYINGDVGRVDAILIARNTIYTCAKNGAVVATADRDSDCRANNLTINGAIAAKTIKFERSVGTRLFSNEGNHGGQAGIKNIGERAVGNPNISGRPMASEVVNFPAYLYFARPYLKDTGSTVYTSLFNSAPRL